MLGADDRRVAQEGLTVADWGLVRAELHAKREALREKGYVVCSSQLYLPPGTKLGWAATQKSLADYSDAQIEDELRRRRQNREREIVEDFQQC